MLKYEIKFDKKKNFSEWYLKVVSVAGLIDYYNIKGCYILKPPAMFMWGKIRKYFDESIEAMGVQEYYFPMLVSKANFEAEKEHVDSFNPELAWITHYGEKKLEEPVALRPTSETIIYPLFSKWISSHRDLPLKTNQWCNIIRWEVKSTSPFIRGREFLWQEGHTAYYLKPEAEKETMDILKLYKSVYTDLLATPTVSGRKSKLETFGGAEYTLTLEAFIPESGKGIQAATSHHLGNNFSKIFNIQASDDVNPGSCSYVYQNCWGITTRSLGIATMVHSDNKGFVCPPRIARNQVVIVPCGITIKKTASEIKSLMEYANEICNCLKKDRNIRAFVDDRKNITPGAKYNEAEAKGIPLRIDVGFKELENKMFSLCRRIDGSKKQFKFDLMVAELIEKELDNMHDQLFNNAVKARDAQTSEVHSYDDMINKLNEKHQILAPWCNQVECEEEIVKRTTVLENDVVVLQGAKSLCIPLEQTSVKGTKCINCSNDAKVMCLFGRSY